MGFDPGLEGFLSEAKREGTFKTEIQHVTKFEDKRQTGGVRRCRCWEWGVGKMLNVNKIT